MVSASSGVSYCGLGPGGHVDLGTWVRQLLRAGFVIVTRDWRGHQWGKGLGGTDFGDWGGCGGSGWEIDVDWANALLVGVER